jgi:hypothetical protein
MKGHIVKVIDVHKVKVMKFHKVRGGHKDSKSEAQMKVTLTRSYPINLGAVRCDPLQRAFGERPRDSAWSSKVACSRT